MTFIAQAASLLSTLFWNCLVLLVAVPVAFVLAVLRDLFSNTCNTSESALFYEGVVAHSRQRPFKNSFRWAARLPPVGSVIGHHRAIKLAFLLWSSATLGGAFEL